MHEMQQLSRREFMGSAIALAAIPRTRPQAVVIQAAGTQNYRVRLAQRELAKGIRALLPAVDVRAADGSERPEGRSRIALRIDRERFRNPEEYEISAGDGGVVFSAAGEQPLLYSVFDFLERQGAFFGLDGDSYPLDAPTALALPEPGRPWRAEPRFAVRGLTPWPNFLNCISVYNEDDFRAYFEAMLRMRFNAFQMHVYSRGTQGSESYLSFDYGGVGHQSFLDTTATPRWGFLPQRTSRFGMGAANFFDAEVFGSDAMRLARDPWEAAERTRTMMQRAFQHADLLGIRTGMGFEPYQVPEEILRAMPPEVRGTNAPGIPFDVESLAAKDVMERRLGEMLEAYPSLGYVWLWEAEGMTWASRKSGVPLSIAPFLQAHAFLRRHAPGKQLVLSGWGGVSRHFEDLHRRLPDDIVFSCLSDSLGWEPVHEVYGKLERRERWPILWLEDDPAMWFPQFHVHRFAADMNRAAGFGCQGVMGIHWRHRTVDPTAAFQSRFSFNRNLTPKEHYRAFARTQAAGARGEELARVLDDADRNRKLVTTFAGEYKDGHAVTYGFSGDYNEAFTFWSKDEPKPAMLTAIREVAAALKGLAKGAPAAEKEPLDYWARQAGFLTPYLDAWLCAQKINRLLERALELRKAGNAEQARALIAGEAIPEWLRLAAKVREAMLEYQELVSNRTEIGQVASMHNKFVRLALIRLRLSMREFVGDLPEELEVAYRAAVRPPEQTPPRLIVPTRPGLLAPGATVRLTVVAPGSAKIERVLLHVRESGGGAWRAIPAALYARRFYQVTLGPFAGSIEPVEYYVSAAGAGQTVVAPGGAPHRPYRLAIA